MTARLSFSETHTAALSSPRPRGIIVAVTVFILFFWLTCQHLRLDPKGPVSQYSPYAEAITFTVDASTGEQKRLEAEESVLKTVSKPDSHAVLSEEMLISFPDSDWADSLRKAAKDMPEVVYIPFGEAISDVSLQGWEDEWLSQAQFDVDRWGKLKEPKIDFVYNWVNGSEEAFKITKYEYEVNSTLNDAKGEWLEKHSINRYRDWDELRYSLRSIELHAGSFLNKIQILVNTVKDFSEGVKTSQMRTQRPTWLKDDAKTREVVEVLRQEDFFGEEVKQCLPTFNSLTIENQIFNTESDTDRLFALSDDMLLGMPHAASDIYSPLFGPTMGFKTDAYNTRKQPDLADAARFGEKPYLIYTSWLLNRRFGERKRKGQVHFGHSLSRNVTREAMATFPRPSIESACERFRGESGFQLYAWYATFHYTIERFREALLWSYISIRSDVDQDGNLSWDERKEIMADLKEGAAREKGGRTRDRMYFKGPQLMADAGLEPPKVNVNILWTSLDGPVSTQNIDCENFEIDQCLAEGFSSNSSDKKFKNPGFSTAAVLDRLARQDSQCGDCFIKIILDQVPRGLEPMLPDPATQHKQRQIVVKALTKYQYTVVDPDAQFIMVEDEEQAQNMLLDRLLYRSKKVGQLCLNDDVPTEEKAAVQGVKQIISTLFVSMFPNKSSFER